MKDKNGKIIEEYDIVAGYDRFGGKWVGRVFRKYVKMADGSYRIQLICCTNQVTWINEDQSDLWEKIGTICDNQIMLLINCNSLVYSINRLIWHIKILLKFKYVTRKKQDWE